MNSYVPSSLYSDSGSRELRELFLDHSQWEWLFSFENRKKIFEIDERFKFTSTIVARRVAAESSEQPPLKAAFMVHDLAAWERFDPPVFDFDRKLIPLFSPVSKSFPEVRTKHDLEVCRKVYDQSCRLGDDTHGWSFDYGRELGMTSDSKLFPPKDKWERDDYKITFFGEWQSNAGRRALPLYEGRMVGQFDFSDKRWISGRGRQAVWHPIPFDQKQIQPQFLMGEEAYCENRQIRKSLKCAIMRISSATNERTVIAAIIPEFPSQHSLFTGIVKRGPTHRLFALVAVLNSFVFDFVVRQRCAGVNVTASVLNESPHPRRLYSDGISELYLAIASCRLCLVHRRFSPEWLCFQNHALWLKQHEWKHGWAVTEADRLRLRVEIDALCADLYGLDPDDFEWIVRDDASDPKGFWRVDKQLPYRERLTGLAAAAFRAIKEGRWSAESTADLSNDEFFDLLGIPELSNAEAAKAKGLPGPLILKRDGCHVWNPENFPEDDPRHGWTWDHCWQHAVTLLGSEDAVQEYIEGKPDEPEEEPEHTGPRDLFGAPIPTALFGNEIRPKGKKRKR